MNSLFCYINRFIFLCLPETRCFKLKTFLYRVQGCKIGENTRICSSARIFGSGKVEIGDNVWIGPEVMIVSSSRVIIEDNVDIGPRVYIGTGTHKIGDINGRMAGSGVNKDVTIKQGAWLAANSTIMPGVTVNEMTIVNSGAVVAKSFDPYDLLGGVPASVIKNLNKNVE